MLVQFGSMLVCSVWFSLGLVAKVLVEFWLSFGSVWVQLGSVWVQCGFTVGSGLVQLVQFWFNFGSVFGSGLVHLVQFGFTVGSGWVHFGSIAHSHTQTHTSTH